MPKRFPLLALILLGTAAPASAQQPALQQQFDAATAALTARKWQEALGLFETLEAQLARTNDRASLGIVRARKGEALLRLGRPKEARAALESGLKDIPADSSRLQEDRGLATLALAETAESNSEQLRLYRSVAEGGYPPIIRLRAMAAVAASMGRQSQRQAVAEYDRAIAYLESSGLRDPMLEASLRSQRASALERAGRYDAARAGYKELMELLPQLMKDSIKFPKGIAVAVVGPESYEPEALRLRETGDVRIGFEIDADGWVTQCRIKEESKSARLDAASCPFLIRRSPLSSRLIAGMAKTGEPREMILRWRAVDPPRGVTLRRNAAVWVRAADSFTIDDYPRESLAAKEQGEVHYALAIDPRGVPTGCRVLKSSGAARLDRHTCSILMARAHLLPALDDAGRPAPSEVVGRLNWALP